MTSITTPIYKIAFLIPCTSNGRNWDNIKQSYLYNLSLKTFLITQDKEHIYKFFIGYDSNDLIYDNMESRTEINRLLSIFGNVDIEFICMDGIEKGFLTRMWNVLFSSAYEEGFDYFYQCGDDISFKTKGWVNDCIKVLSSHNNIGLCGPINNNNRILTQAFVSRTHMEIFGYFFPESIKNWCCDDWYNYVYKPNYFYPLQNHYCSNEGGSPRYIINNDNNFTTNMRDKVANLRRETNIIAQEDKKKIIRYINNR